MGPPSAGCVRGDPRAAAHHPNTVDAIAALHLLIAALPRTSFERLLARLDDLQLVDPGARSYAPSFLIRGLDTLPLRFRRRS